MKTVTRRLAGVAIASVMAAATTAATHAAQPAKKAAAGNTKLVLDMWRAVIDEGSPEAVLRYISPRYIQHNPMIAPGREGLYNAVKAYAELRKKNPETPSHSTKRLLQAFEAGDLVALIWNMDVSEPSDPARTYVANGFDMFRVEDGMVVEHWDEVRKRECVA